MRFPSVSGREELRITAITDRGLYGAFTDSAGGNAQFVAYNAFDGAGIYQVTLDSSLHYKGTSLDGSTLDAQATTNGTTTGTITTGGRVIPFAVRSLALAAPADLAVNGLAPGYTNYVASNQVAGEYVAVIAPGGSHWFGRDGAVQAGSPGVYIIGLDKKERR